MTREEFWEIVKKLVRKDYWDAQSVPSKEVKEILTKSILIPKPKFKVGDKVNRVLDDGTIIYTFKIDTVLYSPGKKRWFYLKDIYFYEEHLIQLVEEEK